MDKRGAGILLHLTSLPSRYGVGDPGPEAYRFADFLGQTRQRYWQVLPLNPPPEERQRLFRYLGRELPAEEVPWALIRLAMMSVAQWVILPMQDVLSLGGEARMNRPAIAWGNWEWRLRPGPMAPWVSEQLLAVTEISGRG